MIRPTPTEDPFPMPCLTCCVLAPDGTVYRDLFGPCEDCKDRGYVVYTIIPPADYNARAEGYGKRE